MNDKPQPAIRVENLNHSYGDRPALVDVDLEIRRGEIFGLLGPNGGGKTTLFRILSTLLEPTSGKVDLLGFDPRKQSDQVRRRIGVVFQSFSLDKILTVEENLRLQGGLYGLGGEELRSRTKNRLERVGLSDRAGDRVGSLSGGMQRRVEVAKGLLHNPEVLLLDEPSTGLDPGARLDLWKYLKQLKEKEGTTILLTTHLMEEAEKCDRLGILSAGRLVAVGTPGDLKSSIGGDVVTIQTSEPDRARARIKEIFNLEATTFDGAVRFEWKHDPNIVAKVSEALPDLVNSITLGKPTLEDVFIRKTGHTFWEEEHE